MYGNSVKKVAFVTCAVFAHGLKEYDNKYFKVGNILSSGLNKRSKII